MKPNRIRFCGGSCLGIFVCLILFAVQFNSFAQGRSDYQTVENFFDAIAENDTNTASQLLEANTNLVFSRDNMSKLPLLEAAKAGNISLVKRMIELGADIHANGDTLGSAGAGMNALDVAAQFGHLEICELLLKAGVHPNLPTPFEQTPLHFAFNNPFAQTNLNQIVSLLLDYGANPFLEAGFNKNTAVEFDITRADGRLVAQMLDQDRQHPLGKKAVVKNLSLNFRGRPVKTSVEILAERGASWLAAAAQRGELEAVQALLKAGVSAKTNSEGNLPLLQAFALSAAEAAKARSSAIEQLQQTRDRLNGFGTNVNPQFLASFRSQEANQEAKVESLAPERWQQILALLIKNGADYDAFAATALGDTNQMRLLLAANKNVIQSRDLDGETPLHWAVKTDQLPLTAFWLVSGASPAATNFAGQTPLHIAAGKNLVEHMKLLLAAHAPTEVRDTNGWTPLDTAEHSQNTEAIRLLLSDKSVVPPPDRAIATSLHDAATSGNLGALVALTETTNNLEARNELGLTPLQVAVLNGHFAEAALLVDRGANVNVRDPDGNTLLHQILLQERNFYVRDRPPTNWLDRMGDDPRKSTYVKYLTVGQNEQGPNPVLQAASFLLACGVDVKATNNAGQTAVQLVTDEKTSRYIFFFEDDKAMLLKLLGSGGGNINEADANGDTALHRAVQIPGLDENISELIANGANVNATNKLGRTPLHLTTMNDYVSTSRVQVLLDAHADPSARDVEGRTPLHYLLMSTEAGYTRAEVAQALLKAGADFSVRDASGKTPLHYLAALGDKSPMFFINGIGDTFVVAKVRLETRDNEGNTPLHIAAKTGTKDVFDWLVSQGASLDATNNLGETPRALAADNTTAFPHFGPPSSETDIFEAVRQGQIEAITKLINADSKLVNAVNQFGQTPLRLATSNGKTNVVEFLAQHGAKWDIVSAVIAGRDDELRDILDREPSAVSKGSLLMAVEHGSLAVVKTLISAGANLNEQDSRGFSPMGEALLLQETNMADLFRQHGAIENIYDAVYLNQPETVAALLAKDSSVLSPTTSSHVMPLTVIALSSGHIDILKLLFDKGAPNGASLLHLAALLNQSEGVPLLFQRGAKVDALDENGFTALHLAAIKGSIEVATLLLKHKPNPNASTSPPAAGSARPMAIMFRLDAFAGDTPLHLAALACQTNMIALLLKSNASVNATNAMGMTPLDLIGQRRSSPNFLFQMQLSFPRVPGLPQPTYSRPDTSPSARQITIDLLKNAGGKKGQTYNGNFNLGMMPRFGENIGVSVSN